MKKRLISMFLVLVMALGLFPISAFAASSTIGGALGEVNITNGGYKMSYLSMNGVVRSQSYTYFNFKSASGAIKEIPAYCINPTTKGVPQSVSPGESIKYIANEASNDPKIVGIIANGYPHRGLSELKLDNKYQAYYATKMALWCYLIDGWSIDRLTVNPSLSGVEKERGEKLLAAAKDIYKRGTWWNRVPQPTITVTADKDSAYPVTIDGKEYLQQVFTADSETWVCDYDIDIGFTMPDEVPEGTRIVDMNNNDITKIRTSPNGASYAGQFKVLYPKDSVSDQTGAVQMSLHAKAKANMAAGGQNFRPSEAEEGSATLPNLPSVEKAVDTRKELAEAVGLGERTMGKVMQIDENAPEVIKEALDKKELSINKGYDLTRQLQDIPEEQREQAAAELLEYEKAKKELKKQDAEIDRKGKIAALFCKAYEKAILLTPSEENVRCWTDGTRMTPEEMRDTVKESREIAQVFAAIADIIEQKILPADWRCVDAGNEENGAQPDGNPA